MRDRKSDIHRRSTESQLRRKLGPDEIVHHKDENKDNNAPSNLTVVDRATHTIDHNKNRGLSKLRKSLSMQARKEKLY